MALKYKTMTPSVMDVDLTTLRTQKARGIVELHSREKHERVRFQIPPFQIAQVRPATMPAHVPGPWFVRPCPTVPRHGFVDSRPAASLAEAQAVWDEAVAVEPFAEMIIMPVVKAQYSAIWANGLLTVGTGNDGATSGHDCIAFPTVDVAPLAPPYKTVKESPFFEFVKQDGLDPFIVQMRDGPAIPKIPDFVPHKPGCDGDNLDEDGKCLTCGPYYKVTQVVKAEGDLLEWESKAKQFAPGTCVEHVGGALSSHYGVHSVMNKVAILTTRVPHVGDMLQPRGPAKKPVNAGALLEGVRIGLHGKFTTRQCGLMMLAGLHNSIAMDLSEARQARWVGAAMAFAIRLGFAACAGEARHAKHSGMSRDQIYKQGWNDFSRSRRAMREAQRLFLTHTWSSSFGGKKWAICAATTIELWNALVTLEAAPAQKQAAFADKAILSLNKVVNCVHNGGFYLNKFLSGEYFDVAGGNADKGIVANPARIAILCLDAIYQIALDAADEQTMAKHRTRKLSRIWVPTLKTLARKGIKANAGVALNLPALGKVSDAPKPAVKSIKPPMPKPKKIGKIVAAQGLIKGGVLHIQYKLDGEPSYEKCDLPLNAAQQQRFALKAVGIATVNSMSGSDTQYTPLTVVGKKFFVGDYCVGEAH